MISLDEDYLGYANDAVIIRALKVCGGMVCTLSNNRVAGAHFTNITTCSEILTALTALRQRCAGNVTAMYFVYNMTAWAARSDKYAAPTTLARELKLMMGYSGVLKMYDKNIIGTSVDIRLDQNTGHIGYRTTPSPDPATRVNVGTVWRVRTARGSTTPTISNLNTIYDHKLPNNVGGFTRFQHSLFAHV